MPSLQLIKTHELATLRLGSHYTGDLIMEQSPVELVLCLRDFGQGNHRIILTPSAFKFSNFSSVNCSILLNKKKIIVTKQKPIDKGKKSKTCILS